MGIASRLPVAPSQPEAHIESIQRRLGVRSGPDRGLDVGARLRPRAPR